MGRATSQREYTEPKYYRVRTELEKMLTTLDEGDSVPAERALSEQFSVSRETVRQALHDLLVEGRIERRGRGTVVSAPKLVQPLSLQSYTEGAKKQGREPGRILVTFTTIVGDDDVCAGLGLAEQVLLMLGINADQVDHRIEELRQALSQSGGDRP